MMRIPLNAVRGRTCHPEDACAQPSKLGMKVPRHGCRPIPQTAPQMQADGYEGVIMQDYNPAAVGRDGPRQPTGRRIDQPHKLAARH
jgi:hypothetical protein